jgi:hypothetical protein
MIICSLLTKETFMNATTVVHESKPAHSWRPLLPASLLFITVFFFFFDAGKFYVLVQREMESGHSLLASI